MVEWEWKGKLNMKKYISLLLVITMMLTTCMIGNAFAMNYTADIGNEATFETMTEARANAPAAMQPFYTRGKYIPHPVMDNYPGDTTYVYRSPHMYGINAAVRINTNLVVYSDQSFATKDDAFAYLSDMGLIDIINEAKGSVILVTPSDPEKGFTAADQKYYYALQTAMFSINVTSKQGEETMAYVDGSYYGGYGYLYVIGLGGGATFLNNYVANTFDYVSRIAGMLLVNGAMDRIRNVATFVPVYLVNADDSIVEKYEAANGTDAILAEGDKITSYNQAYPVRKVVTLDAETPDLKALIKDAYYNLFIKATRGQEITQGLYSASSPYQGYGADSAPYSLSPRNALINGKTVDGIYEFTRVDERFSNIKTEKGDYLQTWFEYLPEEIVNGTAKEGSIPMILALHGGGDDPRQFVEGQGFLELAGKERLVIISPAKEDLHTTDTNGDDFMSKALPELVKYVLATYPAIDASRVYVTGFSMGSLATFRAVYGAPELFAAAYPQSGTRGADPTEEDIKKFENVDIPIVVSTSEYNMAKADKLSPAWLTLLSELLNLNGMEPLPEPDYDAYPIAGFDADIYTKTTLNDDYVQHSWYILNDKGVPMVGTTYIECIIHCLYPQHANMIWDFFKHYSRDLSTGEIVYNPYVR